MAVHTGLTRCTAARRGWHPPPRRRRAAPLQEPGAVMGAVGQPRGVLAGCSGWHGGQCAPSKRPKRGTAFGGGPATTAVGAAPSTAASRSAARPRRPAIIACSSVALELPAIRTLALGPPCCTPSLCACAVLGVVWCVRYVGRPAGGRGVHCSGGRRAGGCGTLDLLLEATYSYYL